jgi:hypothetical protein
VVEAVDQPLADERQEGLGGCLVIANQGADQQPGACTYLQSESENQVKAPDAMRVGMLGHSGSKLDGSIDRAKTHPGYRKAGSKALTECLHPPAVGVSNLESRHPATNFNVSGFRT